MRVNIFHICPFGPGFNIGNFLIQQAVRRMIQNKSSVGVNFITVPAAGYGINSGLSKKVIYQINQVGDGVVVGGGNLFENGEIEVDVNALQSLRKPLMLFSNSYGKIYGTDQKLHRRSDAIPDNVLCSLINAADFVLSRDIATKNHIDKIVLNSNHHVSGCPSIFISELAKDELHKNNADKFGLIAIRNPEQMNIPLSHKVKMHSLTTGIIELMRKNTQNKPKILCNDQRDLEYASSLDCEILYTSDVYEYFQILAHVDTSISFRVHTSLPLWSLGCSAINLSYDERSKSLIETLKMNDYDIDIIKNDSGILGKIEERLERVQHTKFATPSYWNELREVQDNCIEKFLTKVRARI